MRQDRIQTGIRGQVEVFHQLRAHLGWQLAAQRFEQQAPAANDQAGAVVARFPDSLGAVGHRLGELGHILVKHLAGDWDCLNPVNFDRVAEEDFDNTDQPFISQDNQAALEFVQKDFERAQKRLVFDDQAVDHWGWQDEGPPQPGRHAAKGGQPLSVVGQPILQPVTDTINLGLPLLAIFRRLSVELFIFSRFAHQLVEMPKQLALAA